ncbi:MAG: hypothetical protein R2748_16055 [Bryobacterales bacterium]
MSVTDVHAPPGDSSGMGTVEIVVEQRRTIRGNPTDPAIRDLLFNSSRPRIRARGSDR